MAHHGNTRPIVLLPTPNSQNNAQARPNLTHNLQQNTGQPFQNFTPNLQQNTGQSFQNFTPNLQQNTGQPFQNFKPNLQQNIGQPFKNFTPNLQQNTGQSSQNFTPNFTPNTNFINHPNTVNPNPGFVQTVNPNPGLVQTVNPNPGFVQTVNPNSGFVQPPPYNFGQHGVQNINTGNQQFNPQQMHQQVRPSGNQFNVQAARPNINHNVNNSRQQPVGCNTDQFAFGSNAVNHGKQFPQSPQYTRFMACDRPQTRHVSPPQNTLAQSTIRLSGQTNQSSGLLPPPQQHGVNNNNFNVNRNVGIGNQCHTDRSNVSKGAGHVKEKRPTAFQHKPQVGIQTKNPLISFNQQNTSSVGQGYKRRSLLSTPSVNKLVKNATKTRYGRVTRRDIPMKQSYGAHSKGRKISHGYIQGHQNNVVKMTLKSEVKINQISDTSKQKPFEIREVQKVKEQENVTEKGHFEGQQGLDTICSSIEIVPKLSQLQISEVKKERNVSYSSINPKGSRDMKNLIQVKLDHDSENINSKVHITKPEVKPTLDSKDEMKHNMEVKSSYGSNNSEVKVNKSNTDISSGKMPESSKGKATKPSTEISSDKLLGSSKVKFETTKADFIPSDTSLKSPGVMTIGSEAKNIVAEKCTIEKTNTKIERKAENLLSKTKKMNNNEKSMQSGSNSQLDMTGRITTATCVEKSKSNDKKSTAVSNVAQSNLSGQTYQIAKSIKALIKQLDKQNKDVKNRKLPCTSEENICSGESHVSKGLSDKKDRVKKGGKYFLSKAKGENTKARTAKRRDDETTAFGSSENSNKGDNIDIGHKERKFTSKSEVISMGAPAESEQVVVPACKATHSKDSIKLQNSSEIKMSSRSKKSETSVKEAWVDKKSHDFVEMSSDSSNVIEKQSDTEYKRIEEKMDSKISWKKPQQSSFKKEVENKHLKGDVSIDKLKIGDVSSHMIDVSSHQKDNNSTERVPVEDKTLSESKKNNKASITVVNEIEVSGVIVGQEISDLDYVTDNTELEVDADTDMYPRFNNCGNPSQRGRLNQNYYNARQDERYRQSYENQRNFQYPRESYDRRDIPFNQHPNTNRNHYENYQKNYQGDDRRCYDDYHEQDSFTRPPIHNRRYNEGEVFSSDHRQYENTNFNRGRRRNQSQGNIGLPQHERVQRSFSSETAGNRRDFQKSDSYNNSENSKGQETSRNEPNENRQNDDGKGDQSCQKESTDKNNVNNQNLSPRPVVNKNSVPCVFSPGSNIYQSDQYFSAADKLQDGEGKSNVKTTPSKNLKRHMSDIMGNHSESKGVQKGKSPVRRQESAPVGASKEKTPTKMDKMDFSSIKKALNEVKSIDDTCMKGKEEINQNTSEGLTNNSPIQNKTIDNKMESSPVERKRSVDIVKEKISSVQEVIPSSPLQRKNSKEKVNGGKAQSSPRSRNSSGDSQGMLSPKTDAKQRSAFQVVLQREDRSSETSKMSPKDNPSSPLDRKRSSSGDLKQFGIQNPDIKVIDSTYNAISEEEGSLSGSPDKSGISLKSALSYPEWKRLKAQKDLELQKEREKNRKCIELANTPEEYRKLLKLQEKKAREKEKSRKISETETEKKYVENNEKPVNSDEEIESSQLPTLHNSQNSFQAIQDNVGSDEDIDLEESDDDDLEAPSFLFSLEEASNRPIPRTPTKITHLDSPGPCSPAPEADLTDITTKTLLSSKFSLDQLVSEKVDKSEDQREYEEMHAKLEEGLKKGGFVKDTLETVEPQEDEILPEHEKHLQEFKILDSVISEVHPGDVIFQPLLHQSRFTGSLSLQTCGYTPGASFIDKYLSTLQPKDYSLLLTSNILQNTLESVACQEAVLRWLFLLMSVHSNQLVTQGCHKTLLEHLNRQIHFKQLPQTWIPPIPDVLSVFCNYGCEVSRLLPDSIADSTEEYSSHIVHEEQNGMIPRGGNSICRNLHLVLNIIGQCLHSRPRYSSKQLTDLLVILCHVAMDKSHNSEVLPHEFQVCLKGILKSYSSNYWESHCNELCHTLFKITGHHHNRQYLAQLLPEDKRGAYLQRRLAYLYLQDMFDVGRDTDIKDYKIKCLHVYLTKLQKLVPTDVYKLSSAISYLDIAVGNSAIKVAEKEDLQYLCDQLKKISGDVKDSVQMLDRSWVKDMMVRVCSKWTLYLLTVGSKQKSMFAYTKKKTPAVFEIKTVEASQGDISSQSEGEEESKEVPKDIIMDNRTPIITDIQCVDESSNQSQSKTFTLENENCENEIDKEVEKTVIIKIEKPDIIPISDSPMEVDLTEDDLPDLLDHS